MSLIAVKASLYDQTLCSLKRRVGQISGHWILSIHPSFFIGDPQAVCLSSQPN